MRQCAVTPHLIDEIFLIILQSPDDTINRGVKAELTKVKNLMHKNDQGKDLIKWDFG